MPKKTERHQGLGQGEAAARLARWAGALSEAEMALAGGEPQEAERRAKAISAIVRAEADIAQWREQTLGPSRDEETEQDGEAFRRELELRIDRHRREQGLDPLFAGDWQSVDVPLAEDREAYLVEVMDGATVIRAVEVDSPAWTYAAADQIADFGAPPASLKVRAAQISSTYGAGPRAESTIWL